MLSQGVQFRVYDALRSNITYPCKSIMAMSLGLMLGFVQKVITANYVHADHCL